MVRNKHLLSDFDGHGRHPEPFFARGQRVLHHFPRSSSVPGFLDIVGDEEVFGLVRAVARPSGLLTKDAAQTILRWFTEELEKVLPLDGLLVNLHGAFISLLEPDFEGLVLKTVRDIVGEDVVIGAVMDMHANVTRQKIEMPI